MKIERLNIADLKPAEKNTRVHTPTQIEELIRSFRMFGQIRPVIIDEKNVIWCGNGLYEALCKAGETKIDAYRVVNLTEKQKKKLMLADNQTFVLGASNSAVIDEFLAELDDFDVPGYDADTLEQLYGEAEEAISAALSYGIADEETTDRIFKQNETEEAKQNHRVYTEQEASVVAQKNDELPPTIKHTDGMINIPKQENSRPFIVCPKCGEKIWV